MVKIEIERIGDGFHLEAANEQGNVLQMDASSDVGGTNLGMRPMQVVLSAFGGCSTIDIIRILKKQRQDLDDIKITLTGEREEGVTPSVYKKIHAHFKLFGNLDEEKVYKAVSLSVEKYCSVGRMLEKTTIITYSFEIIRPGDH
jgi:putative redox protein